MRNVEIAVHLLGKMQIQHSEAEKWLKELGVSQEGIDRMLFDDEALQKTDAELGVELAGRRCYMSFEVNKDLNPNITQIREKISDYIDNILKVGHGSVIEHMYFMFGLNNVSRVLTAELNRHRAGAAISEGSMRFIRLNDIPYWVPNSIRENPDDAPSVKEKKELSRRCFERVFKNAENEYKLLNEIWASELSEKSSFHNKKGITSMMRRIVPIGVATGGVWTYNLRALRHIFTMRCSEVAEEEILELGGKMLEVMREEEPNFFKDFEKVQGYWKPKYFKV